MSSPAHRQAPQSSLDRLFNALESQGRQPRHQGRTHIQARCPLHEDAKPSLSVDWKPDRNGITRLNCHSCHSPELEILESLGLGLSDRFDQPLPERPHSDTHPRPRRSTATPANRLGPLPKRLTAPSIPADDFGPWEEVRVYDYVNEDATVVGQVVRLERMEGAIRAKTFKQRRPDGRGGWAYSSPERPVMRHLPAVVEAIATGLPVWITEGEKDDEALNSLLRQSTPLGIGTTNNNGAGGFADALLEQLRDANVVLVVDRDGAGYSRAVDLSNRLTGIASSVRVVLSAVTTAKADAADHVAAGLGLADFIELPLEHAHTLTASAAVAKKADRAELEARHAQTALDETQARLAAASAAAKRKAPSAAKDEARFALRWANEAVRHAKSAAAAAEDVFQQLDPLAARLAQFGDPPAELLHRDALIRAEEGMARAQRLAQQAWDACAAPMPAEIREVLLRAAPSALPPEPELDESPDNTVVPFPGGSGGGGGGLTFVGSPVKWTEYDRLPTGVIIERRFDRDGRMSLHGVLSLDARVMRVECLENDTDEPGATLEAASEVPDERRVVSYVIGYTHPETDELITLRVPSDRARSGDWLADLPAMGLKYDSSSKGRAKVWDAIRATSVGAEVVTMYRTTGWRLVGDRWVYIHAGGGITNGGVLSLAVQLPGKLSNVDLPAPLTDAASIRALFDRDSRALMTRLLPHVGAVLSGTAYRAALGWTGPSTMIFGVPGSYKSAVSALTMHHFGTRWERGNTGASMSGNGATLNALREELWAAKDCLFFGDDFAPDKSIDAAATLLGQVSRMQFNRESRDRFDGKTDTVRTGRASRCTLLLTSEVKASSASGQERVTVLDLAKGQLDLPTIVELDSAAGRRGRATVMSSMLAWMSADLPALRAWAATQTGLVAERHRGEGTPDRIAEGLAELEVGWELMARFLTSIGAYTDAEAEQMLTEVRAALKEAGQRSLDPDSPSSVGERCRQMIAAALRSGAIHLTLPGGASPSLPDALQYGHRRVSLGFDQNGQEIVRCEARGEWVGAVATTKFGWRLHVDPTLMLSAILTAARKAGEPLQAGRTVIQRELAAVGILRTQETPEGTRYRCMVTDPLGRPGSQARMWDLDAAAIFGDNEPPAVDDLPVGPTTYPEPSTDDPGPEEPKESEEDFPDHDPLVTATLDPTPETLESAVADSTVSPNVHGDPLKTNPSTGQVLTTVLSPQQPCVGCGNLTEFAFDMVPLHPTCEPPEALCLGCRKPTVDRFGGQPLHPGCDIPAPVATTPPAVGTTAQATPSSSAPAQARPRERTAGAASAWHWPAVVLDPDGIYLPDGTVLVPEPIRSIADLGAIGETLRIGHPAGAGLLVLTTAMVMTLGMLPDEQVLVAPRENGDPASDDDVARRILQFLADQTGFLSNSAGWAADGDALTPWTRIRKNGRTFRVVLEPFVWIWDRRSESNSPFLNLPDVDVDPVGCWQELAHRLARLTELLGMPWSTSPGATGEAIYDQIQRGRERKGGRVLTVAGPIPDLTPTGQGRLEAEFAYKRRPSANELSSASVIQRYDKRGSYLATAGGADLGFGDPEWLDSAAAAAAISHARDHRTERGVKVPFGLWLITLPAWNGAMPAPHPEQRTHEPVKRWVTTATLVLLLDDDDEVAAGAGYSLDSLQVEEGWVWPEQARFLEPWYKRCREALLAAREEEGRSDGPLGRAVKGVYTGYVGRLASQFTAAGARPWHHQPVWEATIRALARASLWRALQRHYLRTGRVPIGIDHDEVGYLDDQVDPRINPPAADNGRLGALKPSGTIEITDVVRRQVAAGTSGLDKNFPTLEPTSGPTSGDKGN